MRVGTDQSKFKPESSENPLVAAGNSPHDISDLIERKFNGSTLSANLYVLGVSEFSSVFENLKSSGLWNGCRFPNADEFADIFKHEHEVDPAQLVICFPEYDAVLKLTFSSGSDRENIEVEILKDFEVEFRRLLGFRVKRHFLKLASLNRINQAVIGDHDFKTIFLTLAGELKTIFDFERFSLITYYPMFQSIRVEGEYDRGPESLNHEHKFIKLSSEDISMFGDGRSAVILQRHDLRKESAVTRLFGPDYERVILMPMMEKGELLASLNLGFKSESEFENEDLEWLSAIGESVTGAVRALYYQSRLETLTANSDNLQDNMLLMEKFRNFTGITRGILHSFNNHLALIMGRAQILKQFSGEVIDRAAADKGLGIILKSSNSAAEQIALLQSYARIKPDADPDRVSVLELFEEIVELSMPHWKSLAGTIEVKVEINEKVQFVGFRRAIREALVNILFNAVEAMAENGGKIRVTADYHENMVVIKVEDQGVGIPRENLSKVFYPFFTTKEHGTGLGLAVTYKIIRDHQGRIEIESEPGKGTTVTLIIPSLFKRRQTDMKSEPDNTT